MNTKNHLMHPRVANNHASNGYFPTDSATIEGITQRLDIAGTDVRIFDPCCGMGEALMQIGNYLSECGSRCHTFGVELDKQRADEASQLLDFVVQSNIENCILQAKTVGLLFMNPPYGFSSSDQLSSERTKRLEEIFFERTIYALQDNGILVFIIPAAALTERMCGEIASRFVDVQMFKAAVDTYKQAVIIGRKPKLRTEIGKTLLKQQQEMLLQYDLAPRITEAAVNGYYEVPHSSIKAFRPINHVVEADLLGQELSSIKGQTLWPQFKNWFGEGLGHEKRRPLCSLGSWHSALALAAGQVNGIVTSPSGRKLLIKGSTYKTKVTSVEEKENGDGNSVFVTTALDRFVPSIRAIDLTENSGSYGDILTIK